MAKRAPRPAGPKKKKKRGGGPPPAIGVSPKRGGPFFGGGFFFLEKKKKKKCFAIQVKVDLVKEPCPSDMRELLIWQKRLLDGLIANSGVDYLMARRAGLQTPGSASPLAIPRLGKTNKLRLVSNRLAHYFHHRSRGSIRSSFPRCNII